MGCKIYKKMSKVEYKIKSFLKWIKEKPIMIKLHGIHGLGSSQTCIGTTTKNKKFKYYKTVEFNLDQKIIINREKLLQILQYVHEFQ